MIDFMANIKNKKNMTMCNIKTLMATSFLCVFFNGVLIYGTEDSNDEKSDNKNNATILNFGGSQQNNNEQQYENEDSVIKEIMEGDEVDEDKIITLRKEKIKDNIFLNFEGDISLLFCFNFCNGKENNMNYYFQKPIEELKNIDKPKPITIHYNQILSPEDDEDK